VSGAGSKCGFVNKCTLLHGPKVWQGVAQMWHRCGTV